MSLAQRTVSKPPAKKRIGGPRQVDQDQDDTYDDEVQDMGSRSASESDAESPDGTAEPTQNSSAAAGSSTGTKTKNKADPPQGPSRRSTRLGTSAPAASRGVSGKGEASPPAKRSKALRANQQANGGEFLPGEQDELLLRERSLEAMEQRILTALRKEILKEQQAQQVAVPASVPPSVTKALYSITALKEKAFEVWLSHVDDAFRGAGMSALFRVSAVKCDSLADQQDLQAISQFPSCWMDAAWTALRQAIGGDDTAYSMSMSVKGGDVIALLRAVRSFYERRAIPHQTQLRSLCVRLPGCQALHRGSGTYFQQVGRSRGCHS